MVSTSSTSQLAASSLSSLCTQRGGGTPNFDAPSRQHYALTHPEADLDPIYAQPKKHLSSVRESPAHLPRRRSPSHEDSDDVFDTTIVPGTSSTETLSEENLVESPVVRRRVPPAPPPRIDSLKSVKRGVIASVPRKVFWSDGRSPPTDAQLFVQQQACGVISDSWYSELLPYKSNTLPRNLSTRLRKRDSLPSGGGLADMSSSWPRAASDSGDEYDSDADPPLPPPPPQGHASSSLASSSPSVEASGTPAATASSSGSGKSLNFAPRAALNIYDQSVPTNACSAASVHRILKPQARPASGSGSCSSPPLEATRASPEEEEGERRPGSPSLKQYQRLYSLNRGLAGRGGQAVVGGGDSEYEEEATMV